MGTRVGVGGAGVDVGGAGVGVGGAGVGASVGAGTVGRIGTGVGVGRARTLPGASGAPGNAKTQAARNTAIRMKARLATKMRCCTTRPAEYNRKLAQTDGPSACRSQAPGEPIGRVSVNIVW